MHLDKGTAAVALPGTRQALCCEGFLVSIVHTPAKALFNDGIVGVARHTTTGSAPLILSPHSSRYDRLFIVGRVRSGAHPWPYHT